MTESIYHASPDVNRFRVFVPQDEADGVKLLDLKQGVTKKVAWTPIRVRTFDEKGGVKKMIADVSGLSALTVVSQRGYDSLNGDLLECEFYPFLWGQNRVWALTTTKLVDCLDETRSQVSRFADGRVWDIQNYVFKSMPPANVYFFHVPQLPSGELLATERAKKLFDAYELTGMTFKPLM